jgi:hypothetical protein
MSGKVNSTILISMDAGEFFEEIRKVVREEVKLATREREIPAPTLLDTPGLIYKPLYDMKEIRHLFSDVCRSTIYEWIKAGRLIPVKINGRGKVFFLWADIERLWKERQLPNTGPSRLSL